MGVEKASAVGMVTVGGGGGAKGSEPVCVCGGGNYYNTMLIRSWYTAMFCLCYYFDIELYHTKEHLLAEVDSVIFPVRTSSKIGWSSGSTSTLAPSRRLALEGGRCELHKEQRQLQRQCLSDGESEM